VLRARRLLPLTCAIALALPSSALAGGAGDDQYQDPFGDQPAETTPQSPPAEPEPAPPSPTEAHSDAAAAAQATPDASAAQPSLPRTGAEAGLTALGGGVLLLAGMALRRRTADDVPR
jgi:LPXTG-motif cell wall-anchored protein